MHRSGSRMSAPSISRLPGRPKPGRRRIGFDLRDLMASGRLEQFAGTLHGELQFLDSAGIPIGASGSVQNFCQLFTQTQFKREGCSDCPLDAVISGAKPNDAILNCQHGIQRLLEPIYSTARQIIGWVASPHLTTDDFRIYRNRVEGAIAEKLWRQKASPEAISHIRRAMGAARSKVERICASERRQHVLAFARQEFATAESGHHVAVGLFKLLNAVAGDFLLAALWQKSSGGKYKILSGDGPSFCEEPAEVNRPGHVGKVLQSGRSHYCRDVLKDKYFERGSTSAHPRTVFTCPIRWGGYCENTVLQIQFSEANALTWDDRTLIEHIADIAGAASQFADTQHQSFPIDKEEWSHFVLRAIRERCRPEEVLKKRREIYARFAREIARLAGPQCIATSLRVLNQRGVLGYVECYSPCDAWTEKSKDLMYKKNQGSACQRALASSDTEYVKRVRAEPDYIRTHRVSKSLMMRRYSIRGYPKGLVAVDWDVEDGAPVGYQARFEELISQLELILEALVDIDGRLFDQLELAINRDELVEQMKKLFQARGCSLFVDRESRGKFALWATAPRQTQGGDPPTYMLGEGLTGTVALKREVGRYRNVIPGHEVANTVRNEGKFREDIDYADSEGHRSWLGAPLVARDRCIGVLRLTVKHTQSGFEEFTHEDEAFLEEIADRLARSLDRAWLAEDAHRKLEEWTNAEAIRQGIRAASEESLGSLGQFLATEFMRAEDVKGVYLAASGLGEKDSGLSATEGIFKILLADTRTLPLPKAQMFCRDIWATNASHELSELKATLKRIFRKDAEQEVRSICILSLNFRDRKNYKGVLALCGDFTASDDRSFDAMANQAAEAIEPGLTLDAKERALSEKVRQLELISNMTREFASTTFVEDLGNMILKFCLERSNFERGTIRLYDHERGDWVRLAPDDADETERPRRIQSSRLLEECLQQKTLRVLENTANEEIWTSYRGSLPQGTRVESLRKVGCWVGIPLQFEDRYLGIILLEAFEPCKINEDQRQFLELLAGAASMALRSALRLKDEQDLSQPFALIGSMMSGFLHIMRNCLNNIGPPLRLLQQPEESISRDELHVSIDREVTRMKEIVKGVALLAQRRGTDEILDLGALAERCCAGVASDFRDVILRVEIKTTVEPQALLRGNRSQLEIGIRMLLQNSLEAMSPDGGKLGVHVRNRGSAVSIHVLDSGPGMTIETRRNCLRPFFTTKQTGNGLGLAISLGIVRRHGGRLRISTEVGRGSRFTMRFRKEVD